MNVLFALYGDLSTNSAVPLGLHARELHRRGHACAVAVPPGLASAIEPPDPALRVVDYGHALANPEAAFPDGRPADVLHAWSPRECVRLFVTGYLAKRPTPWIVYLEDNEGWIARAALDMVGLRRDVMLEHAEEIISAWTPEGLPHALRYDSFIGLADAAVVIQDKLAVDVPAWVPCTTVMPGVDLDLFSPRPADARLRERYGVAAHERVIVYPGGLNDFTRPGLEALCQAVGHINRRGTACRLLRSGPVALDFLDRLPPEAAASVSDLGALPRGDLPGLLALADVFVQPGKPDPFEDLRLPGKLPELFATGRPVVLPDTNIAYMLRDGVDAVIHRTGSAEEIADKCLSLFADPQRAREIGEAGRRFAQTHFDPAAQADRLESVYRSTIDTHDPEIARNLWTSDATRAPVQSLLARKLRMLAKAQGASRIASPALLMAYAELVEAALQRSRALETGMAHRDREIASLKEQIEARDARIGGLNREIAQWDQHVAALKSSLSWRMTAPLRFAHDLARRLRSRLLP